jgi:hypothetical protein
MRKQFTDPELEVVRLDNTDIICASSCGGSGSEILDEDSCTEEI